MIAHTVASLVASVAYRGNADQLEPQKDLTNPHLSPAAICYANLSLFADLSVGRNRALRQTGFYVIE